MAQSVFDSILQQTAPVIDAMFGKTFVYRRRGQSVSLEAILSSHGIDLDSDGKPMMETTHSHNFEITAADLVLGGETVLPEPGGHFVETMPDGTAAVYEVVKSARGRCYDPIDSEGNRLLVYAKEIRRREVQ